MHLLIMKNEVSDTNISSLLYRGNVISHQREITANISIPKTFLSVKQTISYFRRKTIHLQEFFLIHLQLIFYPFRTAENCNANQERNYSKG